MKPAVEDSSSDEMYVEEDTESELIENQIA